MRTLITDDDDAMRMVARLLVEEEGCSVVGEAASGEEALVCVDELGPQLVLMDFRLPGMDGVAATAEIKRRRPDTTVIGWTSHGDPAVARGYLEAGATASIDKGNVPELRRALRRVAAL